MERAERQTATLGGASSTAWSSSRSAAETAGAFAWRRLWVLAAVSLIVVALAILEILPIWPGLVHLVALPPLDMYTDLRLIVTQAPSWPVAVTALVGIPALRIVVMAYLLGALNRANLDLSARFYALLMLPLLVAAAVVSVAAAMPHSYLFWIGIGVLAPVVVGCAAAPWLGTTRLRSAFQRTWRQGLRLEVLLPYLVTVMALGVLADRVAELTLLLVPVSALATAVALYFLQRPPVRRPGLLGALALVAALMVTGVLVDDRRSEVSVQEPPRQEGSLMVMAGIDSTSGEGTMLGTQPEELGYTCEQLYYFSYAGAGEGQPRGHAVCPNTSGAPYEREDTQRPLDELVEVFVEQTEDLPRPLVVAGHSNSAWVAWEAAARGEAEIDVLVLAGPMPDSPVGYPLPRQDGTGRVLGDLLRLFAPVAAFFDYEPHPDAPQARELQADPNASRAIYSQPLPEEVRTLSVTVTRDLALMPGGWRLDVDHNACPVQASHAELPLTSEYTEELIRFLDGQPGLECSALRGWYSTLALPFAAAPGG